MTLPPPSQVPVLFAEKRERDGAASVVIALSLFARKVLGKPGMLFRITR
jgi:hypothetical protein